MKTEIQVFEDGSISTSVRPLTNKELENKIFDLADIIAELIDESVVDTKEAVRLHNRLEEIKKDLN